CEWPGNWNAFHWKSIRRVNGDCDNWWGALLHAVHDCPERSKQRSPWRSKSLCIDEFHNVIQRNSTSELSRCGHLHSRYRLRTPADQRSWRDCCPGINAEQRKLHSLSWSIRREHQRLRHHLGRFGNDNFSRI